MFSKNITWQDRPFDFGDEEAITLDTKLVHKIQYNAKRYRKGHVDCCEVRIAFLDSQGREITALESHDIPEDSVLHTYEKSIQFDQATEVLGDTEMIIGARIRQNHKGANAGIQFLISEKNPAKNKKGC